MINVLLIGDSITAGQFVPPKFRWTTHVIREFAQLAASDISIEVNAISGETTRDAVPRLARLVNEYQVDFIMLQFGLNDANVWLSEGGNHPRVGIPAFRANLVEMIDRSFAAGVREVFLATNHVVLKRLSDGRSLNDLKLSYDTQIRALADGERIHLIDIAQRFEQFGTERIASTLLPDPDLVHLSPAGHLVYSQMVSEVLVTRLLAHQSGDRNEHSP